MNNILDTYTLRPLSHASPKSFIIQYVEVNWLNGKGVNLKLSSVHYHLVPIYNLFLQLTTTHYVYNEGK